MKLKIVKGLLYSQNSTFTLTSSFTSFFLEWKASYVRVVWNNQVCGKVCASSWNCLFIFAIIVKKTTVCLWVEGSNIILKVWNVGLRFTLYLGTVYTWHWATREASSEQTYYLTVINAVRVYFLNSQRARTSHLETYNRCLCVLLVPQFVLSHKIYRWWGSPGVNTVYGFVQNRAI